MNVCVLVSESFLCFQEFVVSLWCCGSVMGRQPDGDVSHAILPALISPDRSFSSASFPELNRDTDISLHVVSFTELTVAVAEHLMVRCDGVQTKEK